MGDRLIGFLKKDPALAWNGRPVNAVSDLLFDPLNLPANFPTFSRPGFAGIIVLILAGCSGLHETAPDDTAIPAPNKNAEGRAPTSAQLQQNIMDFSDSYVSALWLALEEYIRNEPDPARQTKAQKWKVMLGATSMTIAASKDPRAGLLDMAVFISAGKWAVDHDWIPNVFGEKAAPLRALYKEMDQKIWTEVDRVLSPAQQSDLRSLIAAWEKANPPRNELLDVRLRNLDGVTLSRFAETPSARGLLASVQRVLGTVDQSLLYGERMIFYMERMPRMLAQQSDLTIDRVAEKFPIATIDPDFSGLSDMLAGFQQQIIDTLQDKEGAVSKSLPEVRASVESAERLAQSLQQTLDSVSLLSTKIENLPFEREDYARALRETSTSLTQLNGIVTGLNQLLDTEPGGEPRPVQLARLLDERADQLLDKAFQRALVLIGVFFAGVLLSLLAAKAIFQRKPGSPAP